MQKKKIDFIPVVFNCTIQCDITTYLYYNKIGSYAWQFLIGGFWNELFKSDKQKPYKQYKDAILKYTQSAN